MMSTNWDFLSYWNETTTIPITSNFSLHVGKYLSQYPPTVSTIVDIVPATYVHLLHVIVVEVILVTMAISIMALLLVTVVLPLIALGFLAAGLCCGCVPFEWLGKRHTRVKKQQSKCDI